MSDAKTVLVVGATGLLGRPVAACLVEDGFNVRALVRDPARARSLLPAACDRAAGDLRDVPSLERAVDGADAARQVLATGTYPVKRVQ